MQKQKVSKLSKQQTLNLVRLNDVYAPENAPMDFLLDIIESKKSFVRSSAALVMSNDIMNSSNFNGNKIAVMMRGNKKAAAKLLGLNRTTLVEKIKKKGLEGKIEVCVISDESNA